MFNSIARLSLTMLVLLISSIALGMSAEVEALCNQGEEEIRSGNSEAAISTFAEAIELDPECAEAWFGRGWAYFKEDSNELCLQDFEKALELDPDYGRTYIGIAWLAMDSGDDDYIKNKLRSTI